MTYQTLNSLPISKSDIDELMQYDKDYVYKLRTDDKELMKYVVEHAVDYNTDLFTMIMHTHNDLIMQTEEFKSWRSKQIEYYTDGLKEGNIKILGSDYCWLCSNKYHTPTNPITTRFVRFRVTNMLLVKSKRSQLYFTLATKNNIPRYSKSAGNFSF